ncbi:MAG: hypothetical protein LC713_02425 [Actinobacteria bacterium]|nr:hypothetical protein [Actinomycetota bacterium]
MAGSAKRVVAYSVPTADGAVIVICHAAPGPSSAQLRRCELVASTLRLKNVQTVPLRVLVAEQRQLGEIVRNLGRRRSADRLLLSRAYAPPARLEASKQLQAGYRDARRSLQQLVLKRASTRRQELVKAVTRVERAYGGLTRAAGSFGADYDGARRAVDRAEGELGPLLVPPAA